jgi:type I restriction enzyme, S subunit
MGEPVRGWERCRLGDLVDRRTERNSRQDATVLTISASDGLVEQSTYFNRVVASTDLSTYFTLQPGDFAYTKSYSAGYPVGVIRRLERGESGVVSPLYICFRAKSGVVDPDFLNQMFRAGALDRSITMIAKEGARNHGLLNVGSSDFFGLVVDVPSLEEQHRIAEILGTVDQAIEATKRTLVKSIGFRQGTMSRLLEPGFSEPVPVGWSRERLDSLLATRQPAMRSGPFGSSLLKSELIDDGFHC